MLFLNYKKELLQNISGVEVSDFGAGSKPISSSRKKISKTAKYVVISNKKALQLMNLIQYFKPKYILEVGSSLGISTAVMSTMSQTTTITSLQECQETGNIAKQMFKKYLMCNIKLVIEGFETSLSRELKRKTFDFIYFDRNHSKRATIEYFKLIALSIKNDAVLVVDDIHRSKGMEQAWNHIKSHPKVTVTIDTYHWGLVFFHKGQEKERFTIRI